MIRTARHAVALTIFAGIVTIAMPATAQTTNQSDALKAATDRMNAIKGATGVKPTRSSKLPPGDPCSLIPLATVRSIFPTVKAGENTHRIEDILDTTECVWNDAAGHSQLILHGSYSDAPNAKADAVDMAAMYTGGKAGQNVRIETFPSIGADNAGFAEVADTQRGLKNDMDFVGVRKGKYAVGIGAMGLVGRDRGQMMKALETLGKEAANRM